MNAAGLSGMTFPDPEAAPIIEVSTAIIILLAAGVLVLWRAWSKARREVEHLRDLLSRVEAVVRPASPPEPTPQELAVITAAVLVALDGAARITQVAAPVPAREWPLEGRRDVFASHRVR